jgi:hypothetical protein
MMLEPVDRLEILVLVDNATDVLSSTPPTADRICRIGDLFSLTQSRHRCLAIASANHTDP